MAKSKTKNSIIFVFILVISIFSIDYLYTENLKNKNLDYLKFTFYEKLIENQKEIDYLFLGDSHVREGINPVLINNKSFNWGNSAESYIETYFLLKKVLEEDNIKVNNVVLQLDLHTFSDKLRTKDKLFSNIKFYNNFVSIREMAELKNESIKDVFIKSKLEFLGKGFIVMKYSKGDWEVLELNEQGWAKNTGNFSLVGDWQERQTRAKSQFTNHFGKELIENDTYEYFFKTINLAKKNNINIIIVSYPVSNSYLKVLDFAPKDKFYNKILNEISEVTNYTYYDFSNIYKNRTDYFADPDHLNYYGSEKFTLKFIKEVVE